MSVEEKIEEINSIESCLKRKRADSQEFIDEIPYEQFGYEREEAINEANSFLQDYSWEAAFEEPGEAVEYYLRIEETGAESPSTTESAQTPASPF